MDQPEQIDASNAAERDASGSGGAEGLLGLASWFAAAVSLTAWVVAWTQAMTLHQDVEDRAGRLFNAPSAIQISELTGQAQLQLEQFQTFAMGATALAALLFLGLTSVRVAG